jgi:His/Glu/Gln/Arg/opine family amino acid ABC transporter permease subunit
VSLDFGVILIVWPALARGALVTIQLTLVVLALATPLAVLVALARDAKSRAIHLPFAVASWILRGIPPLLVLFIIFFGLPHVGVKLDPFPSATLAMTLYMAFYFGEVFRGGLASVPQGQFQAARALGLSPTRSFVRIILPQTVPAVLPPYISHATEVLKGTALTAAVAVPELTGAAKEAFVATFRPIEILLVAALAYALMDGVLITLQFRGERWAAARRARS